MKVKREITMHTDTLEVGDRIKVKFPMETHWATAYKKKGSVVFFIFDDCLDELRPMNFQDTTEGGYEESELRKVLIAASEQLPEKLKKKMVPDGNGDYLYLLSLREVCGCNEKFEDVSGQLDFFKERRNRIATCKADEYANWWLRDVVSATNFASVHGSGNASNNYASHATIGVRPAFAISSDL